MKLWLYYLCTFFAIILVRYFLVAGTTYWLFYSSGKRSFVKTPNNLKSPNFPAIKQDIILSLFASLASAICSAILMTIYNSGATRLYTAIEQYGIWYLFISFWVVILLQDTCYYFFHRGFHHPLVYNWLHRGHHGSQHPTPWTSFALDFPEALIQGLFVVVIVLIVPLHIYVLGLWLLTMTIWAVVNHLGFELVPSFFPPWLGKWFIGSDYHSLHHRNHSRHYGLYFTFWDRLGGTN